MISEGNVDMKTNLVLFFASSCAPEAGVDVSSMELGLLI